MIKCRLSRLPGDRRMSVLELKRRTELACVTLQKTLTVSLNTVCHIMFFHILINL